MNPRKDRNRFATVGCSLVLVLFSLVLWPYLSLAQVIHDDIAQPFDLSRKPPLRIVSMAPNVTEILFALGLEDKIVGVTRFCDYPEKASTRTKIGGLVDPGVEIIESLKPNLVIAFRGNPLRVINRLKAANIPVFVLNTGNDLDSLFLMIQKIGLVTGAEKSAIKLADSLRQRRDMIIARTSPSSKKPRVLFILPGQGLWAAGRGSYLSGLVRIAGGVNAIDQVSEKWILYKKEQLVRDKPDYIFILSSSDKNFSYWKNKLELDFRSFQLPVFLKGRVFRLDENQASRFGPRLLTVLERLAACLHQSELDEIK